MTPPAHITRDAAIVACAVSAGIHAALIPEHVAEETPMGVAFAAATLALAAVVVALTRRPAATWPAVAAAGLLAALIAGYALAVAAGLPALHPEREPVDGLALACKAVEAAGLLAAGALVRGGGGAVALALPTFHREEPA